MRAEKERSLEEVMANMLSPTRPDLPLARRFLQSAGHSLRTLAMRQEEELARVRGATPEQAKVLASALSLAPYLQQEALPTYGQRVIFSFEAYRLLKPHFSGLTHEEAWIMMLDNQQQVLDCKPIAVGGLQRAFVDVKKVFSMALKQPTCTKIIFAHNHPTQDLEPSPEDEQLTRRLKRAGKYLDIQLADHLICAEKQYYSFSDEGIL